jgi:hypothetical protein
VTELRIRLSTDSLKLLAREASKRNLTAAAFAEQLIDALIRYELVEIVSP